MVDWTASMQQSFEYYIVDPDTWKDSKKLDTVKSCSISYDAEAETLGSATIDITESIGECYIRIYLITIQNNIEERHPLGTFMVQTPSSSFDGKITTVSMDSYTPLIELKENPPPLGYSIPKDENIMDIAYRLVRENARAPVVKTDSSTTLHNDFVADTNDTWITFITALIANAKYTFALDELGRILFSPKQDTASLQPIWDYKDDNSSVLQPNIDIDHDLYGVPNVVEVVYSSGRDYYDVRVVNDDPNSPTSTVNRGREIKRRVVNPDSMGNATEEHIKEYARLLLRELSSLEYTVSYTHGYCPVRINDCVRLDYKDAKLNNVKAKVIKQNIKCEAGCQVTETAVFTVKLWG